MMIFAYRIRDLRRDANMTGGELGEKMGVSKVTVSAWENGTNYPNQETLNKIADYFNVSLDYLMGRTDEKRPHKLIGDNFVATFSGLSSELTEEQKKYMVDIANDLVAANSFRKGKK